MCFGKFLDLKPISMHGQLIHSLLIREVKQPNPHELWIKISEKFLCFGLGEFSLITGLNCSNGLLKDKLETGNLGLKTRFFKDMKKVNRQFVEQAFTFGVFPSDEDAVKLAVLYL